MKVYVLACFEMTVYKDRITALTDSLTSMLKPLSEGSCFLNVTSSGVSFLNDARRLVKGDPPPTFNSSFSNRHSKKSRGSQRSTNRDTK